MGRGDVGTRGPWYLGGESEEVAFGDVRITLGLDAGALQAEPARGGAAAAGGARRHRARPVVLDAVAAGFVFGRHLQSSGAVVSKAVRWRRATREFEWRCGEHVGDRWESPEGGLDGAGCAVRQEMGPPEVGGSLRGLRLWTHDG